MKILLTGTHFTPAQAVIEELKKDPEVQIVYLGRRSTKEGDHTPSVESQVLPKLGVKFIPIITGRFQRTLTLYTIPSLLKIPLGFLMSFYYLLQENPDVVLSFGGYVSVPVVICAWLLSIPIIVHEQTITPGLANRISAVFADKIALSFPNARYDPAKSILTGNPLRKEILAAAEKSTGGLSHEYQKIINNTAKPLLLVLGGNQGSHLINLAVEESLPDWCSQYAVIHQTGDSKYQDYERLAKLEVENYLAVKWINVGDLGLLMKEADLVITRSGINTMMELAYFGTPALLIPYPYLPYNEQVKNADYFANLGLAKVLLQNDLTKDTLRENIAQIISNLKEYQLKAKAAGSLVIKDAAKRLSLETILLANLNHSARKIDFH